MERRAYRQELIIHANHVRRLKWFYLHLIFFSNYIRVHIQNHMQESLAGLRHSPIGLTVSRYLYVQRTVLGVAVNRNVYSSNWEGETITFLKADYKKHSKCKVSARC